MKTRYSDGLPFATIEINSSEIEALIDTGFSGSLLLPAVKTKELGLKRKEHVDCMLADGRCVEMEVFISEVKWLKNKKTIRVFSSELNLALIGMNLLKDAKTTIDPSKDIIKIEESS